MAWAKGREQQAIRCDLVPASQRADQAVAYASSGQLSTQPDHHDCRPLSLKNEISNSYIADTALWTASAASCRTLIGAETGEWVRFDPRGHFERSRHRWPRCRLISALTFNHCAIRLAQCSFTATLGRASKLDITGSSADQKTSSNEKFGVAAPQIALPKGGGALHGIGEKFAANPVTGTAVRGRLTS